MTMVDLLAAIWIARVEKPTRDIEAGKVDCIVVYKVDRLSRSLMDFAKMLEVFERKSVAFVSVTQQFNTTNSWAG